MKLIIVTHSKLNTKIYLNPNEISFFFYAMAHNHVEIVMKNGQVVQAIDSADDILKQME